jgi:hypothetical protein
VGLLQKEGNSMSDLRKAAELALKALEELRFANAPFLDEAMEALRQALSQTEQECIYPECETGIGCDGPCGEKPVDETAKRRHEPGLWIVQYKDRHEFVWGAKPVFRGDTVLGLKPLYTAPPSIEAAVLAEREACAKLCEQPIDEIQVTDDCSDIIYMDGLECAAAIRARGEK